MARQHGKTGLVELQGPGVAPVVVAAVSAWTFGATQEKIDVTGMSDSSIIRVLGLPDYSGTFDFFWDDAIVTVKAAVTYQNANGLPYTLVIYPDGQLSTTHYMKGSAFLDYSREGGVKAAVAEKATWVAAPGTVWADV